MLSLSLARQLKKAGLLWEPQMHDIFAIPDRELDERRFVLTDVMAYIEVFKGSPVVTFHGTAEWALDFILQTEAVWIPSESQLRDRIQQYATDVVLRQTDSGFECDLHYDGESLSFGADGACEAYGSALLQLLWRQDADPDTN
ncbi:MAG: pilus assembly protein CpaE [Chloroflexota bacterium]